jgi:NADH-quinone oxidoreductase subunit G
MEAALRTAHFALTKERLPTMELKDIRGLDGVKEASLKVAAQEVRVAVAHCMGNVEKVLDKVRAAREKGQETPFHFIEVMACRGGCVGGGGQPYGATDEIRRQRAAGIYRDDEKSAFRCSHENPMVQSSTPTSSAPRWARSRISSCTPATPSARSTSGSFLRPPPPCVAVNQVGRPWR